MTLRSIIYHAQGWPKIQAMGGASERIGAIDGTLAGGAGAGNT